MKKYCHLCGGKYVEGKIQPWVCPDCDNLSFSNPVPSSLIVLFDKQERVLIAKRAIDPGKGKYDLPGGFVEPGETLEAALVREIEEELGLKEDDYTTPIYVTSNNGDYEFSKEVFNFTDTNFTAKFLGNKEIVPNDDVDSAVFVSLDELDQYDFSLPILLETIEKAHKLLFK